MVTIDARRRIDRPRDASKPASQTGRQAGRQAANLASQVTGSQVLQFCHRLQQIPLHRFKLEHDIWSILYTSAQQKWNYDRELWIRRNSQLRINCLFYTLKFQIANAFVVLMSDKFSGLRSHWHKLKSQMTRLKSDKMAAYFVSEMIRICTSQDIDFHDFVFYLFICGSVNDAVSSSHYLASNYRMINEWLIGKDLEGSGSGLFQGTTSTFAWKDRETTKNSGYWATGGAANRTSLECESETLVFE